MKKTVLKKISILDRWGQRFFNRCIKSGSMSREDYLNLTFISNRIKTLERGVK